MTKKKIKTVKGLVKQLREVRDAINKELQNMTREQRTEYFRKMRLRNNSPQLKV